MTNKIQSITLQVTSDGKSSSSSSPGFVDPQSDSGQKLSALFAVHATDTGSRAKSSVGAAFRRRLSKLFRRKTKCKANGLLVVLTGSTVGDFLCLA